MLAAATRPIVDPVVIFVLIIAVALGSGIAYAAYLQSVASQAKTAYDVAIQKLKRDPNNADLRQETLQLDQVYTEWKILDEI